MTPALFIAAIVGAVAVGLMFAAASIRLIEGYEEYRECRRDDDEVGR